MARVEEGAWLASASVLARNSVLGSGTPTTGLSSRITPVDGPVVSAWDGCSNSPFVGH
ncbi:MAG: hypothetical protein ACJARS_004645 [bacterium]|jgi:hypothetical protein